MLPPGRAEVLLADEQPRDLHRVPDAHQDAADQQREDLIDPTGPGWVSAVRIGNGDSTRAGDS